MGADQSRADNGEAASLRNATSAGGASGVGSKFSRKFRFHRNKKTASYSPTKQQQNQVDRAERQQQQQNFSGKPLHQSNGGTTNGNCNEVNDKNGVKPLSSTKPENLNNKDDRLSTLPSSARRSPEAGDAPVASPSEQREPPNGTDNLLAQHKCSSDESSSCGCDGHDARSSFTFFPRKTQPYRKHSLAAFRQNRKCCWAANAEGTCVSCGVASAPLRRKFSDNTAYTMRTSIRLDKYPRKQSDYFMRPQKSTSIISTLRTTVLAEESNKETMGDSLESASTARVDVETNGLDKVGNCNRLLGNSNKRIPFTKSATSGDSQARNDRTRGPLEHLASEEPELEAEEQPPDKASPIPASVTPQQTTSWAHRKSKLAPLRLVASLTGGVDASGGDASQSLLQRRLAAFAQQLSPRVRRPRAASKDADVMRPQPLNAAANDEPTASLARRSLSIRREQSMPSMVAATVVGSWRNNLLSPATVEHHYDKDSSSGYRSGGSTAPIDCSADPSTSTTPFSGSAPRAYSGFGMLFKKNSEKSRRADAADPPSCGKRSSPRSSNGSAAALFRGASASEDSLATHEDFPVKDYHLSDQSHEVLMQIIRCFPFPSPRSSPRLPPKCAVVGDSTVMCSPDGAAPAFSHSSDHPISNSNKKPSLTRTVSHDVPSVTTPAFDSSAPPSPSLSFWRRGRPQATAPLTDSANLSNGGGGGGPWNNLTKRFLNKHHPNALSGTENIDTAGGGALTNKRSGSLKKTNNQVSSLKSNRKLSRSGSNIATGAERKHLFGGDAKKGALGRLCQVSVDTMAITALPLDCWLKERLKNWVQLSGHEGTIVPASNHTLWKKQPCQNTIEAVAYAAIMKDSALRGLTPKFFKEILHKNESFIEIQDLLSQFPNTSARAVMDIKIGSRTFLESEVSNSTKRTDLYKKMIDIAPDEPSEEEHAEKAITKLRYMQFRERESSTASLGFRIEAAQLPGGKLQKSFKKVRTRDQVAETLLHFFGERGDEICVQLAERLRAIRHGIEHSEFFKSHEVVGSSILIVYDATRTGAWMIDFAKSTKVPDHIELNHRDQWELGNHEDGYLTGLDNLISIVENARSTKAEGVMQNRPEIIA